MAVPATTARTSIEFIVRPKQDLHLEGTLRRIPRVIKGEAYPCQMQKTQNFSCLFRHYAKHNGLRKEDLIFTFVDELQPDQTPESVHLMPQDEILVEHRNSEVNEQEKLPNPEILFFSDQFRVLLETGIHSDVTFRVGEDKELIFAHKAILSARSEYFNAMFREGGMCESIQNTPINITYEPTAFRRMLEFIYTNHVQDIHTCSGNEVISLLVLSNEYLLQELRQLCETNASKLISLENIGRFMLLSQENNASVLRRACAGFVDENKIVLAQDAGFRQEIENCPELGLILFELSVPRGLDNNDSSDSPETKRRRITRDNNTNDGDDNNNGSNTIAQSNVNVQEF